MFRLKKRYAEEMIAHARAEAPNECCGVLAGESGRITKLFRATNAEMSPVRYNIDSRELLGIYQEIERKEWEFLGIYHSHTHSQAYPSSTDVQLALWPDSIYFIVSLMDKERPQIRAFRIIDGMISEEDLEVEA
jgi:proteasome lid subunit RPN8/RPN11